MVDLKGWTGLCLSFPRSSYEQLRRDERQYEILCRAGAYLLLGPDPSAKGLDRIYVGEGVRVRDRLNKHLRDKSFWDRCYVLTTTDGSLDKAHVQQLEAKLYALAQRAGSMVLDNRDKPTPLALSQAKEAEVAAYLDTALSLFPLLGGLPVLLDGDGIDTGTHAGRRPLNCLSVSPE
ncbi:GIY-YIG nuclease family protein [Kitasatospora sp. MMS16-BH015]|uniref:GIY-YIG nuclease family protein n=1 Tax=Kitasatospora sp. MMS16-BH015 TaxID=2018025 RepID=UPI000CF258D7|nr:GIY-YIG nuclease family protein [Kitasatospora sp. MMS16-BH015]